MDEPVLIDSERVENVQPKESAIYRKSKTKNTGNFCLVCFLSISPLHFGQWLLISPLSRTSDMLFAFFEKKKKRGQWSSSRHFYVFFPP